MGTDVRFFCNQDLYATRKGRWRTIRGLARCGNDRHPTFDDLEVIEAVALLMEAPLAEAKCLDANMAVRAVAMTNEIFQSDFLWLGLKLGEEFPLLPAQIKDGA